MIIIPERQLIVILVPRTGTGTIRRLVEQRYSKSFMLYRHMEADGVPFGYAAWNKVAVIRDPVERLFSLYKFCFDAKSEFPGYKIRMKNSVRNKTFTDWLLTNEIPFSTMYDNEQTAGAPKEAVHPKYACLHQIPENRKSQWHYVRPDLGTTWFSYHRLDSFLHFLDLRNEQGLRVNATSPTQPLQADLLESEAKAHINKFFAWELNELCMGAL